MSVALELKNVSFSYENINIFKDINLSINYNEITLISGHSGCGKTTLLYLLSGIIPNIIDGKIDGEIFVNGESINNKPLGNITHKVGVVLQNADEQIIQKNIEDEIAFGCENLAFSPEKIKKQIDITCKLMKLDKNWECRKLSGGQKQRLITASTLAMGEKIIILDEPLANLDTEGTSILMNTLKTLSKSGYAIMIIEHRLDEVLPYVDKVFHVENHTISEINDKNKYLNSQSFEIEDICDKFIKNDLLFSIKNINYVIKKKEILNDISFEIYKGSRNVILGENGCGKTTLLRIISRIIKQNKGSITQYIDPKFKQKHKSNKKWFKKVGIVYQNPDYQLFMPTVEKELKFNAYSNEYADKIASLLHIKELYSRHPQSLSEGQKRRVSIAAILAIKPEVLILDEPTVGQDYEGLRDLVNALNKIHKETNNTIISITHDKRCAKALCDYAMWMKDGKIYKMGNKELIDEFFSNLSIK